MNKTIIYIAHINDLYNSHLIVESKSLFFQFECFAMKWTVSK